MQLTALVARSLRLSLFASLSLMVVTGGCGSDAGDNAVEVAKACGQQKCPTGTAFAEKRAVTTGSDISGGFNPATYSADGAYKRFGTGECEYVCSVIQACPMGTFPFITETCFTCAAIAADGMTVVQPQNCK